MSVFLTRY